MPAFRDELTKKEGAHMRLSLLARTSSNALLKKVESNGGERWGRTRARRGRVCARLCVDRGVNKRYTNVSHLGVYPSSFRWPVLFFVSLPSDGRSRSLDEAPPLLRRQARARSGSLACRARRSRGVGEREATASRVSAVVTLVAALQHHP